MLSILSGIVFSSVQICNSSLPDNIRVYNTDEIKLQSFLKIDNQNIKAASVSGDNTKSSVNYNISPKIFGIIPVKSIAVSEIDKMKVAVSGEPFGIKIFTKGVIVVGMSDVETKNGECNPAYKSGIRVGDVITSLSGYNVESNEDVAYVIEQCKGKKVVAKVIRDKKNYTFDFYPAKCVADNKYKAGLWVRDSSAGIGTMTFYSPVNKIFAGLGHAICDVDTGKILPLESGEIVGADINGIVKSEKGCAGELCGTFNEKHLGDLYVNSKDGLFGVLADVKNDKLYDVATKTDIKTGKAKIVCDIDNKGKREYDCVIEKIDLSNKAEHDMIIRITDKELLNKTGGIVQGMSGSPIIQDDKVVGAVTHVFLNYSDKGYAIFAETMYYQMMSVKVD